MKNTYSRATTFSSVLMNCTIVLLLSIFLISYMTPIKEVSSNLKVVWLSPGNGFKVVRLVPNIDLTPQFGFNIKQIFLYVVVKTEEKQEMVWSKIVKNGNNYKFFDMVQSNYYIEPKNTKNLTFEIRGSIIPYTGQILDVIYGKAKY